MSLRLSLYRGFLKAPDFKGKSRIEALIRKIVFRNDVIRLPDGFLMALDPCEWVQRDLLAFGQTEPLTGKLYATLLKQGDVYVDVGCHVGYHTLLARLSTGSNGRVIAIDPQPYNCERILTNWRLNGFDNISVFVAAAGASNGIVSLPDQPPTDKSRLSLTERVDQSSPRKFSVAILRLDGLLATELISKVALLKIDTEGYESEVLKGAGESLSKIENLILELLPQARGNGGKAAGLLGLLQKAGFECLTVEGRKWVLADELPENNLWARKLSARDT